MFLTDECWDVDLAADGRSVRTGSGGDKSLYAHWCYAPNCRKVVNYSRMMCDEHWQKLPEEIKSLVFASRDGFEGVHPEPGQEAPSIWKGALVTAVSHYSNGGSAGRWDDLSGEIAEEFQIADSIEDRMEEAAAWIKDRKAERSRIGFNPSSSPLRARPAIVEGEADDSEPPIEDEAKLLAWIAEESTRLEALRSLRIKQERERFAKENRVKVGRVRIARKHATPEGDLVRFEKITQAGADELVGQLSEAISANGTAAAFFEAAKWPDGIQCVHCASKEIGRVKSARRAALFFCRSCNRQFTFMVGTIMQDSKIDLGKWLAAIYLQSATGSKWVSALRMQKALGIGSYVSARMLAQKIRFVLADTTALTGTLPRARCLMDFAIATKRIVTSEQQMVTAYPPSKRSAAL